jgi:hypothetical protein
LLGATKGFVADGGVGIAGAVPCCALRTEAVTICNEHPATHRHIELCIDSLIRQKLWPILKKKLK